MDAKWRRLATGGFHLVTVLVILFWTLAPFYWMVVSSVSLQKDLITVPIRWLPREVTFERYRAMLFEGSVLHRGVPVTGPAQVFKQGLLNSTVVAGVSTGVSLLLGSLSAYALARLRFRGRGILMVLAIAVQMIPPIATIIPLYMLLRGIGLLNTRTALILVYSSFTVAYVIWVMHGFFRTIPKELEEAARIDGCTRLGALFRVLLPVAAPGLVATGLLSFLTAWSEFMYALILVNQPVAKTVPVLVAEFSTQYGIDYGMMMTGGVLASLPPALLAILFERQLTRGLMTGAVKG